MNCYFCNSIMNGSDYNSHCYRSDHQFISSGNYKSLLTHPFLPNDVWTYEYCLQKRNDHFTLTKFILENKKMIDIKIPSTRDMWLIAKDKSKLDKLFVLL